MSSNRRNNRICVSDEHHAWLKSEAKRRGVKMWEFVDRIVTDELERKGHVQPLRVVK